MSPVSRALPVHTAMPNCTRDEGGPFEVGNQVLISGHRKGRRDRLALQSCTRRSPLEAGSGPARVAYAWTNSFRKSQFPEPIDDLVGRRSQPVRFALVSGHQHSKIERQLRATCGRPGRRRQRPPVHYDRAVFPFGELAGHPMNRPAIQPIKPENGMGASGAKTRRPMPESESRKSGYGPNQSGMLSMA
jgi:hypothetical protein